MPLFYNISRFTLAVFRVSQFDFDNKLDVDNMYLEEEHTHKNV